MLLLAAREAESGEAETEKREGRGFGDGGNGCRRYGSQYPEINVVRANRVARVLTQTTHAISKGKTIRTVIVSQSKRALPGEVSVVEAGVAGGDVAAGDAEQVVPLQEAEHEVSKPETAEVKDAETIIIARAVSKQAEIEGQVVVIASGAERSIAVSPVGVFNALAANKVTCCWRRLKIDHLCRLKIDQAL